MTQNLGSWSKNLDRYLVPPLSDEESAYVDRKTGVTYNFSIIAPMEWSISDRRTCINWWKSRIDDAPGILRANGDVHLFILSQLFASLLGKNRK